MTDAKEILDRKVVYSGDGISVRELEDSINTERNRQNDRLSELTDLRTRNADLQLALSKEMERLKNLSKTLSEERQNKGVWRKLFAWLPWIRSEDETRKSIEDLLRRQYEVSAMRLKEAAEFADRLEAAKSDLYDEMERLNKKIVESARNEEAGADYVMELRDLKKELDEKLYDVEPSSAEEREIQAQLDRTTRLLAEHTMKLRLYSTAEERIDKLKRNTRQLAETIAQLQADITRYVTVASEKMDLVSGQIQAIGAAADASMVMLELKQSLDAMTESINHTTRFVSETQQYFRQNVDSMIDDLQLYDEETERVMQDNLATNEVLDEMDVEDALSSALAKKIDALADETIDQHADGGAAGPSPTEPAPAEQPEEAPAEVPATETS